MVQTRFSQMKKKLGLEDTTKSPITRKPKGNEGPSKVTKPAKSIGKKKGAVKPALEPGPEPEPEPEPEPKVGIKDEEVEENPNLLKLKDIEGRDNPDVHVKKEPGWLDIDLNPCMFPF